MAGILIWGVIAVVTFLFNLTRSQTYLPLFALISVGILGAIDDWFNIRGIGGIKGIRSRYKMIWLFLIAALGAWWFYSKLGFNSLHIPAYGDIAIGLWYIPLFIFIILAITNAVNITDGLDGLSGGLLGIAFVSYGLLAYLGGQVSLAIFCATVAGVLLSVHIVCNRNRNLVRVNLHHDGPIEKRQLYSCITFFRPTDRDHHLGRRPCRRA